MLKGTCGQDGDEEDEGKKGGAGGKVKASRRKGEKERGLGLLVKREMERDRGRYSVMEDK